MTLPLQPPTPSRSSVANCIHKVFCGLALTVLLVSGIPAAAQENLPQRTDPPLILSGTIALPNVEGRIDHFATDPGARIFICVIGNDTVEVLETLTEKAIQPLG